MGSIRLADDWDDPGWISVPRSIVRDQSLSFKALGIVTYLSSHKSGFRLNRRFIVDSHKDGEDSVKAGIRELRVAGYLTVERGRDDDGQLTSEVDYVLHRTCRRETHQQGNPPGGESATKRDTTKENPSEREDLLTEVSDASGVDQERQDEEVLFDAPGTPSVQASLPEGFEEFWAAYPRKVSKKAAMIKYRAALKAKHSPATILAGLKQSTDRWVREQRAAEFIPHAATWLNQERFMDGAEEEAAVQQAAQEVVADERVIADDPAGWLRGEWRASRVDRVHRYFRGVYLPPELDIVEHGRLNREQYLERVVAPYNRAWIEKHRADILAAIATKVSEVAR